MNEPQPPDGPRHFAVGQGEMRVSDQKDVVLTAMPVTGIAICLFDPVAGVGGINHFLLPADTGADDSSSRRSGLNEMELLINAMLAKGASRVRLKARIFGGATVGGGAGTDGASGGGVDVAGANIAFARRFLRDERISLVAEDVGGTQTRRVEFRAALGLARCDPIDGNAAAGMTATAATPAAPPATTALGTPCPTEPGDAEFF